MSSLTPNDLVQKTKPQFKGRGGYPERGGVNGMKRNLANAIPMMTRAQEMKGFFKDDKNPDRR
jgi:hypothetical protein